MIRAGILRKGKPKLPLCKHPPLLQTMLCSTGILPAAQPVPVWLYLLLLPAARLSFAGRPLYTYPFLAVVGRQYQYGCNLYPKMH